MGDFELASSFLYVPADRPALFDKAMSSDADAVIFDLEDAVSPAQKPLARELLSQYLENMSKDQRADVEKVPEVWVRINPIILHGSKGIDQLSDDVDSCLYPVLAGIVLAKCQDIEQLMSLAAILKSRFQERSLVEIPAISALIETPMGVMNLKSICSSGICRHLQLGEADLGSATGIDPSSSDSFLMVRSQIVMVSAAYGLNPPIGPAMTDFKDKDLFRSGSTKLKGLGFAGRSCIHPSQIDIVNEVFHPSQTELAKAAELLALYQTQKDAGNGVFVGTNGKMVDLAVVKAAFRLLGKEVEDS